MNYAKYLIINMKVVENFIMDYKDKKNLPVDEFGILGKNGKQGPLCRYMPKNKVCYVLAGPGSSLEK